MVAWWLPVILGALLTASFGFWGWLAVKVVEQGGKICDIEARMKIREIECINRMEWLTRMDAKLNKVSEDVAHIRGALEHNGIERRKQ
jgi:hypothetical protein